MTSQGWRPVSEQAIFYQRLNAKLQQLTVSSSKYHVHKKGALII
ncbi:MAG: hypothetical protein ACJA2J_001210 [Candidatus Azotimanducaceae bacterium]|jgi:hypothetical protein